MGDRDMFSAGGGGGGGAGGGAGGAQTEKQATLRHWMVKVSPSPLSGVSATSHCQHYHWLRPASLKNPMSNRFPL